jgi:hypothetical protein
MPILSTKGGASSSGFGGIGGGAGGGDALYNFAVGTSFTFDHGGRNGPVGPANYIQAGYNSSTYPWVADSNILSFPTAGYSNAQGSTNGVQKWMVPADGTYRFLIRGASSTHAHFAGQRSNYYGRGAQFTADVDLVGGTYLGIIVGQLPINTGNWTYTYPGSAAPSGADLFVGGGGASHVWDFDTGVAILSAGGGGSNRTDYTASPSNQPARTNLTVGDTYSIANPGGNGGAGTNGNGGTGSNSDGGTSGAGIYGNGDGSGSYYQPATRGVGGGFGAYGINMPNPSGYLPHGGLGGGGAGGWGGSAGGGGYSGGGSGTNSNPVGWGGGGSNYAIAGSTIVVTPYQTNGGGTVTVTRMS